MSKELNEFEKIIVRLEYLEHRYTIDKGIPEYPIPSFDVENIKEALQRLEAIDNVNPSKALEALNWNPIIREEMDYEDYYAINKALQLFDKIVEYFMYQGNIECLFRNSLLGIPYQKYCENCKDEIKLTNPIDKETYYDLSKCFKEKITK